MKVSYKLFLSVVLLLSALHSFSQEEINFTTEPEKLPSTINSQYKEASPRISADGNRLFYIVWEHPQNLAKSHDIWYSDKVDGKWTQGVHMSPPLTSKGGNTSVETIFPDGNTMMLFGYYSRITDNIKSGFSIARKDKKGWRFPIPQYVDKLYNYTNWTNYCLAPSGKEALVSVEYKGEGQHDLYVTFLTKKANTWSKPKNLGKVINTKGVETQAFLSADGKTLFFSSDGHGGHGGWDIFMSKRLDDTWTNWTEPKNLGPKINGPNDDYDFSIDAAGKYAYFVSDRDGTSDIFRILLAEEAKPDPLVLVSGVVLNQKTNEPLYAEIKYYDLETGTEIGYANSDPTTGEYKIALPKGKKYSYYAQSTNYYTIRENLDLIELGEYKELERNLYLAPVEKGEVIRLNNIFFETAKATLLPESNAELDKLVELLSNNSALNIAIKGHTDNVGSHEANQQLSNDRAKAVYDYLINKKIKSKRLQFTGYGETAPVTTNETEEGRSLNRRVEFEVL